MSDEGLRERVERIQRELGVDRLTAAEIAAAEKREPPSGQGTTRPLRIRSKQM